MEKLTTAITSNAIARAILSILFGIFLAVWSETATLIMVYILVAYLAVMGIFSIISYFVQKKKGLANQGTLLIAVFLLVLALIVFLFPQAVAGLLALLFGVLLLVSGLVNMFLAAGLRSLGGKMWIGLLVFSLLLAIGGVIIIVNPFEAAVSFTLFLGILFIAKGIVDLAVYLSTRQKDKSLARGNLRNH